MNLKLKHLFNFNYIELIINKYLAQSIIIFVKHDWFSIKN